MAIIFGMDKRSFNENFFEKNFYIKNNAFKKDLFSWGELNDALYCLDPKAPFIRLHKNGVVPEDEYIETYSEVGYQRRRIIKEVFYEYLRHGATAVLNRIEIKSPKIKQLCVQVSQFVNAQTLANGYLAFGGEGTFGNHWDTHDVFVIQLLGRKHWRVYEPTFQLPLTSQTSKLHKHECPSEPVFEGILEVGDIMYIPRGWWHNALPLEEETFHVAVGVHPAHVMDYIRWMCSAVLPEILECRRSVRPEGNNFDHVLQATSLVTQALLERHHYDAFLSALLKEDRINPPFNLETCLKSDSPVEMMMDAVIR